MELSREQRTLARCTSRVCTSFGVIGQYGLRRLQAYAGSRACGFVFNCRGCSQTLGDEIRAQAWEKA